MWDMIEKYETNLLSVGFSHTILEWRTSIMSVGVAVVFLKKSKRPVVSDYIDKS